MLLKAERKLIVEYGKKLLDSGLTKGTGGNISICNKDKGLMAMSPSGMNYYEIKPKDIVVMDLTGKVVDGRRKPSVEHSMHRIFYTDRQDINAVVHTHSVACSTMAALHWELPASNYLVAFSGDTKVPCTPYETFATKELAKAALKTMGKGYACFLGNHGFLAASSNVEMAFTIAEEIEHCAEIYLRAKSVGKPKIIPDEKMMELFEMFKAYGQGEKK
ncbi:MAG: L-fuculose-phosphate aldolase [Saprospiraceae bacterium]